VILKAKATIVMEVERGLRFWVDDFIGRGCKPRCRRYEFRARKIKHKIPHPYSAAEENAASLTGIRDDEAKFDFSVRERDRAGEGDCVPHLHSNHS